LQRIPWISQRNALRKKVMTRVETAECSSRQFGFYGESMPRLAGDAVLPFGYVAVASCRFRRRLQLNNRDLDSHSELKRA
jgi:hypothetical protein